MKIQSIYNSKILKRGLEFASDNSSLFVATASATFATARLGAILATPKTDERNKKYACMKALSSSLVGYGLMLFASLPIAKSVKNIDENPEKFLNPKTIDALKNGEKSLAKSSRYNFATQLFKLGLGLLLVLPKSWLTCNFIPPLMKKIFPDKSAAPAQTAHSSPPLAQDKPKTSFTGNLYQTGTEKISKLIGKIIDTKFVKKLSEKFADTNFEQHILSLTDVFATGAFIWNVQHNKKIEEERKKPLIYNSAIATGLSISAGYGLHVLLKKPTEKFIENFKRVNANSPKLDKYLHGIGVARPTLILGTIYYLFIPVISTFTADRFAKTGK